MVFYNNKSNQKSNILSITNNFIVLIRLLILLLLLISSTSIVQLNSSRPIISFCHAGVFFRKRHPKVKVLIIAGEGNVEGFASISHLRDLIKATTTHHPSAANDKHDETKEVSTTTYTPYSHLINNNNNNNDNTITWSIRDDVFVSYEHYHSGGDSNSNANAVQQDTLLYSKLTMNSTLAGNGVSFGPEIQIGHIFGQMYNNNNNNNNNKEPIIIVKAGWHDRSLMKDFMNGFHYYRFMNTLEQTIKKLPIIINNKQYKHSTIEYIGMIWWQGYTDCYQLEHNLMTKYEENLLYFLNKVRTTIRQPELPIAIIELGISGTSSQHVPSIENQFRIMQQNVVNKLHTTTTYVPTAHIAEQYLYSTTNNIIIHPRNEKQYYYGRADIMLLISQNAALALIELIDQIEYSKRHWIWNFIFHTTKKSNQNQNNNMNTALETDDTNHHQQQEDEEVFQIQSTVFFLALLCTVSFIGIGYLVFQKIQEEEDDDNNNNNNYYNNPKLLLRQTKANYKYVIKHYFRPKLTTIYEHVGITATNNDDDDYDENYNDAVERRGKNELKIHLEKINAHEIEQRSRVTNNYGVQPQY